MSGPHVTWIMGSDSDLPFLEGGIELMKQLAIPFEVRVFSAHRTPAALTSYLEEAPRRGVKVIIAAAGWAAALAGVSAAHTTLPVIGVPIPNSPLQGLDAILATVQMPGGVPVATMALGSAGARNATVFAAGILALSDPELDQRLKAYRARMAAQVAEKDVEIRTRFGG